MRQEYRFFLLTIWCGLLLLSCSQGKKKELEGKDLALYKKASDLFTEYKLNEAVKILDTLAERHPDNQLVLFLYGKCLLYSGDPDRAAEYAKKAYELNPGSIDTALLYSRVLLDRQERSEAERILKQIVTLSEYNIDANVLLANLYLEDDDLTGAMYYLLKIKNMENSLGEWYYTLGELYNHLDDDVQALSSLEKARLLHNKESFRKKVDIKYEEIKK